MTARVCPTGRARVKSRRPARGDSPQAVGLADPLDGRVASRAASATSGPGRSGEADGRLASPPRRRGRGGDRPVGLRVGGLEERCVSAHASSTGKAAATLCAGPPPGRAASALSPARRDHGLRRGSSRVRGHGRDRAGPPRARPRAVADLRRPPRAQPASADAALRRRRRGRHRVGGIEGARRTRRHTSECRGGQAATFRPRCRSARVEVALVVARRAVLAEGLEVDEVELLRTASPWRGEATPRAGGARRASRGDREQHAEADGDAAPGQPARPRGGPGRQRAARRRSSAGSGA